MVVLMQLAGLILIVAAVAVLAGGGWALGAAGVLMVLAPEAAK